MKLLIGGDVVPNGDTNEKYFIEGDVKTIFGKAVEKDPDKSGKVRRVMPRSADRFRANRKEQKKA